MRGGRVPGWEAEDGERRRPVADVLVGLEVHPLPPGWTAIEALVLVKCLDEDGEPTWCYRTTHRLNREELLGALIVHTDVLRKELRDGWVEEEQ
jgi:hypothetical protein